MVPVWMSFSNQYFTVTIIQHQLENGTTVYLQWPTNRKLYMICRTAPFSITLNDPYPHFQGHPHFGTSFDGLMSFWFPAIRQINIVVAWRWISQTVRDTDIVSSYFRVESWSNQYKLRFAVCCNNLAKFVILYIFYYSLFCYYVYLWWVKLINGI